MFYFASIDIENEFSPALENAVRNCSIRRHASLDLLKSYGFHGEEKKFLARETKAGLQITRIKNFLEQFLPKLIVAVSFTKKTSHVRVRLGLLPFLLFLFILINTGGHITAVIEEKRMSADFITFVFAVFGFFLLVRIEFYMTKKRLVLAVKKYYLENLAIGMSGTHS